MGYNKNLMKKALRFVLVAGSILVAYLFSFIYVVLPVAVPWAVRSQGSKILKHPVEVRSVGLNPFLLRVTVSGLTIRDPDTREVMVGFERFWVDASFLSLLKKQCRIETVALDGLLVNVELLPDNRINLMDVVPAPAGPPHQEPPPAQPSPAEPQTPAAVPDVAVDTIRMTGGTVTFTDRTVTPAFTTTMSAMDLNITGFSTQKDSLAQVAFSSKLDDRGTMTVQTQIKPFAVPLELETAFSLNEYALAVLTPYVGKYTGRAVKPGGKLDLSMDYRIADNKLNARHKLLIQKFDFGEKVESPDALTLPFGLVVALLEDPQGRITVSLPVTGDLSDPQFAYFPLLGKVAMNFLMKLVTSPFLALMSMAGVESGTEEMGSVAFEPGSVELSAASREKLVLFAKTLKERPKLSLEINGGYDPGADWKAMKLQSYDEEFARRRLESTGDDQAITEQMYTLRFGKRDYWAVARKFMDGKTVDAAGLQQEMKRLIIEEGDPDKPALELLAQARAQAVYDLILAEGFDAGRVSLGATREVAASMGQVPLEFTLTVFGSGEDEGVPVTQ